MIAATYAISGLLLAGIGFLFSHDVLSAGSLTAGWMIVFFFASAAASSAYLTVGEIFPLEIRALAIAFFYAIGTGIGGIAGPWVFGALIDTGSRPSVLIGYLIGAFLMVAAALAFTNYALSREAQKAFTERMFYAPVNAKADVAPDALARTAASPENRARMIPVDWAEIAKVRDQWNNRWRREVIAAR